MSQHTRRTRINSLLVELAADFLRAEANIDPMITVTDASASADLKRATIYVTVFPNDRENDALTFLKRKSGEFRSLVKQKTNLKHTPFFAFEIDQGEKNRQRIDEISREE